MKNTHNPKVCSECGRPFMTVDRDHQDRRQQHFEPRNAEGGEFRASRRTRDYGDYRDEGYIRRDSRNEGMPREERPRSSGDAPRRYFSEKPERQSFSSDRRDGNRRDDNRRDEPQRPFDRDRRKPFAPFQARDTRARDERNGREERVMPSFTRSAKREQPAISFDARSESTSFKPKRKPFFKKKRDE